MQYKKYNDYELVYMVRENELSKDLLYRKYQPLLRKISEEFYRQYKYYGCDYEDFLQEANIAFEKAIINFDDSKESLFYSFVDLCVKRRLISFSRNISNSKKNISAHYYIDINETIEKTHANEIEELRAGQESAKELFDRTTSAFMAAIDDKNEYTRGHSKRVAEYARRIAILSGKNDEECQEIYYSALVHDVGKLGLPDTVLEKGEEITEAEHELVKQKTVIGDQILSSITDFPYLRDAAHYSHERYDGTGYPEGLKGEEIPEAARIVAVASAYDTMTTANSKRDPMPDQVIREKFIRESGKKFDPRFAGMIIRMIDADSNFQIVSGNKPEKLLLKDEYFFDEYKKNITPGIVITHNVEQISFRTRPHEKKEGEFFETSLILFDSYDGRVHENAESVTTFRYMEYGEIWLSGNYVCTSARKMDVKITDKEPAEGEHVHLIRHDDQYTVTLGRYRDHLQMKIENDLKVMDIIVALPDNSRWAYVAFSGEHAHIDGLKVIKTGAWSGGPGCHGGCGVELYVKDGKLLKVEGDESHPFLNGRLCPRALALTQYAYHPNRLQYPLHRVGARGENKWGRISWDEALDEIEYNFNKIKKEDGPESMIFGQGTGQ